MLAYIIFIYVFLVTFIISAVYGMINSSKMYKYDRWFGVMLFSAIGMLVGILGILCL